MQQRFTLIKNTKNKKYLLLFFVFVFMFFYFFINNIKFNEILPYYGYTKNYQQPQYLYSDKSGIVLNIFVHNNDIIKPNQNIYSFRHNHKEEIQQYLGDSTETIKAVYVELNQKINENEKIIEFKNINNDFYIESFIPENMITLIKENNKVVLEFEKQNYKHTGFIEDINKNIFTKEEIKNFSGFNFSENGYKIKIRILAAPTNIREGHKVNFKILREKKPLKYFILKSIKESFSSDI